MFVHPAQLQSELHDVAITTSDHVQLLAWYIRPLQENGNTVMLLHGLADNRLGTVGYAEILLAHGYSVLMPDARAHGISGGDLATYGVVEVMTFGDGFNCWRRVIIQVASSD
jgi:hypothetical protein